jgi:Transcriptional regulator
LLGEFNRNYIDKKLVYDIIKLRYSESSSQMRICVWGGITILKINKSAARAIDILTLLVNSSKALTQLEISEVLDIPRSSTFELIYTLMDKGVIEFENKELKTFKLSIKMFEMGSAVLKNMDLYQVSRPFLEKLSKETNETVFMGCENQGEVVYLDRVEKAATSITTAAGIGMRRPIHCTGFGKALLATYSDAKVREVWDRYDRTEAYTKTTITTYDALVKDLKVTRQRGFAIDNREREDEIFCVAAPIYDRTDTAVAAISIAAIYLKMDEAKITLFGNMIMDTALQISKKIGYQKNSLF